MKNHTKEKSKIREKQVKKDYSKGNASPYREWVDGVNHQQDGHNQYEPAEANPDTLNESDGLYYQMPCEDDRLDKIYKVIKFLNNEQKEILRMCGNEGRTMENCAAILKISKRKVQTTIEKIRKLTLQK